MTFLHNAWYAAGWSHEFGDTFVARTFLDTPVLLLRSADGSLVAMHDQCPHRFAPLSRGQRIGERVRCGYHGLEFDTQGRCVAHSLGRPVPKAAQVRVFPTFEQDRIAWIWLGDAPPADTGGLQRFPFHALDDTVYGHTHARSDYRLLQDNLLDLMHVHLLHPAFGGIDFPSRFTSREDEASVTCHYRSDFPASPSIEENTIRWTPPSVHYLESTSTHKPDGQPHTIPSAHLLTPATRHSTHYFWSSGPVPGLDAAASHDFYVQLFDHEDKPMVEAVQGRMGERELWEMSPILLGDDAGAIRARRRLEALIAQEQQGG